VSVSKPGDQRVIGQLGQLGATQQLVKTGVISRPEMSPFDQLPSALGRVARCRKATSTERVGEQHRPPTEKRRPATAT
jgi:hypothetical protein